MLSDRLVDFFKVMHQNPELSGVEFKTTELIGEYLDVLGVSYELLDGTGLVAYVDNGFDFSYGFRCDIDALPIVEETNLEYASVNGSMHACGHDGHTTLLLGFIERVLGLSVGANLVFVFQPSEEVDGGAEKIVVSGVLDRFNIKAIFGTHLWPMLDYGVVSCKPGAQMATNYSFGVRIKGSKSHAATPHLGIDSSVVLGQLILGYQSVISKAVDPFDSVVINIGLITGGVARNVVMDDVYVEGTVRAFDDGLLRGVVDKLCAINCGLEVAYGVKIDLCELEQSYPVVYNDVELTNQILEGALLVELLDVGSMASEDFGYYQLSFPGVFFFLGTRTECNSSQLHTSTFGFDLDVLEVGIDNYLDVLRVLGVYDGGD